MFSQHKYNLPENAQNLPNTDDNRQQSDTLSTGHKYDPQSKTHFNDHAMQPGNGRYPVMFNQQKAAAKAHARDEEEDSGEEGDSEGSDDEKDTAATGAGAAPMKVGAPAGPTKETADQDEVRPAAPVNHMSKAERDAYYSTDELRTFS